MFDLLLKKQLGALAQLQILDAISDAGTLAFSMDRLLLQGVVPCDLEQICDPAEGNTVLLLVTFGRFWSLKEKKTM
eukprot:1137431-Pelagomonas_calceolata.AAC.1